jgi:hypothetical protein
VRVRGDLPAERAPDEEVLRGRRQPVLAAEDVRDAHGVIVDDDGEVVRGEAVGLQQDLVLDGAQWPLDVSVHEVVQRDNALVRHLQPHNVRLALRALGRLLRIDAPTEAVVARDLLARGLLRAQSGQALLRAEAEVGGATVDEVLRVLLIEGEALGLDIRSVRAALARALVPCHAQPGEPVVDRVDRSRHEAVLVGVLDPQDELPAVLPREEVVVERRADAPDVERACGRWREADANGHT